MRCRTGRLSRWAPAPSLPARGHEAGASPYRGGARCVGGETAPARQLGVRARTCGALIARGARVRRTGRAHGVLPQESAIFPILMTNGTLSGHTCRNRFFPDRSEAQHVRHPALPLVGARRRGGERVVPKPPRVGHMVSRAAAHT